MIIKSFLFAIASFILTLILPFITIPVFVIFGFYSVIINCVLKFKYGSLFGGFLKGNDAFWGLEDKSKGIITSFIVIETTQTFENFLQTLKTNILDKFYKHESRLQSTRQKFGGYSFLLKNQYRIEDSFKVVNVNNTTLDHNFIQKCSCEDMPKNDTGLWEILIFDKPIQWIEKNCFAFVFRCHHTLGDGFALLDLLLHLFSDKDGRQQPSDATHRAKWTQLGHTTKWYTLLWYILFGPAIVIIRKLLRSPDRNFLHKPNLCGDRIIAWTLEEKEELVQIVKMVKNSVPGLRFSDVILAAISKSLREFFLKKGEKVPDHITCVIPVLLKDRPDSNILDLTNRYTVAELTLPILSHNNILKEVNQQTTKLKNSPDFYVNHWFLNILAPILPEPVLKPILYSADSTAIITILPGLNNVNTSNEYLVRDVLFWAPTRADTGITLSVFTHDNRLQVGLTVDKMLISSQKDAQMIVDGVFRSIIDIYKTTFVEK